MTAIISKQQDLRTRTRTKHKRIRMVKDTFSQCDACLAWFRLFPVDETGMRTIDLISICDRETGIVDSSICDLCHDTIEEKCYDAGLDHDDKEWRRMELREVKAMRAKLLREGNRRI